MIRNLFISMRPRQWLKNLFVFASLLFVRALGEPDKITLATGAFALFCCASSAVYLLNDVRDIEKDRAHPIKRSRPVASGRMTSRAAAFFSLLLACLAIGGGFLLNILFGFVITGYLFLHVAYSFYIKQVVILDVFSIAAGFVLRVVGGAVAISAPVSVWILLCTFFLTLFLAVNKRKGEFELSGGKTRAVLSDYFPAFFEHMNSVTLSATLITYSFYTFSSEHSQLLMLTIPIVLYGLFYYLYALTKRERGDNDPTDIVLREKNLQITIAVWILTSLAILSFA